jgi:hypothetical protein
MRTMATGPMRVGPYQLLGQIGQGGMGTVYKARHLQLGVERAIKLLSRSTTSQGTARFDREIRTLAAARHPALVALHESGVEHGVPWFAMDLVPGEPLDAVLTRGPLPVRRAMQVTAEVARALDALHEVGVVHRDVKPQNILLRQDGHPVVIDLGLAVCPESDERLTKTGAIVGTPQYMAPEQLGGVDPSPRTDVHALGLLLYELVVGRAALAGPGSVHDVVARVLGPGRPRLGEADARVPAALDELCARAMAREPDARPARAGELADALDELLRVPGPTVAALRRQRATRGVALGLALVGAIGVGAVALRLRPKTAPREVPTATPPPAPGTSTGPAATEAPASPPPGASLADRLAAASDGARLGRVPVVTLASEGTLPQALVAGGRIVTWSLEGKLASWSTDDLRAPAASRDLVGLAVTDAAPVGDAVVLLCRRKTGPVVLRVDPVTLASIESTPRVTAALEQLDPYLGGRQAPRQDVAVYRGAVAQLGDDAVIATGGGLVVLDGSTLALEAVLVDPQASGQTVACAAGSGAHFAVGGQQGDSELAAHGVVRTWPARVLLDAVGGGSQGALPPATTYTAPTAVVAVAVSPVDRVVAYGTDQGSAFVVRISDTGGMYTTKPLVAKGTAESELLTPTAHSRGLVGLAFTRDGRRLVSAASSGPPVEATAMAELRVWEPGEQALLLERVGLAPRGDLARAPTCVRPGPSAELLLVGLELWRVAE